MIIRELNKEEFKTLLKNTPIYCKGYYGTLYRDGDNLLKINNTYIRDYTLYHKLREKGLVDLEQMAIYEEKKPFIKNSMLPKGIIKYKGIWIGVIYDIYDNYDTFDSLYKEDSDLIINNIRLSIIKNMELINNDIYNTDLCNDNILYQDNNVELIDLDGSFIKYDKKYLYETYFYYILGIESVIFNKLKSLYGQEEYTKIWNKMETFFQISKDIDINFPNIVMDNVEKMKVLK